MIAFSGLVASIMILALGDSFSHIVGKFFGRTRQPFSVKLLEGTFAGIVAGFCGAVFFVPVWEAFFAATIAMLLEAVELRFFAFRIDDNLYIPAASALIIIGVHAIL